MLQPVRAADSVDDFLDLDLEDLLSLEVTSVSKKKQRLTDAAAAIFVISQDDIRRSGVTNIADALRMAPGVQVAQIDANKWAISTRGFNGQFANKLLILIDGRSVYTPSFSGVYWDLQDTLIEDIDRIEIIRGPGATLWGANAVNGVINIITRYASETTGGLITAGGGDEEKGFASLRYGMDLDENTQGRFYVKGFQRDSFVLGSDGSDAGDSWESLRSGFRIDGADGGDNSWTVQGDVYDTDSHQIIGALWSDPTLVDPASISPLPPPGTTIPTANTRFKDTINNRGWNLLSRWNHTVSADSSTSLQVYYDYNRRQEAFIGQTYKTMDAEFQHNLNIAQTQQLIWGLGYRQIEDQTTGSFAVSVTPQRQTVDLYNFFIQDQIEISPDKLFLTIGSKFEYNDYTGSEIQPSIRGLWKPDPKSSVWSSVSRAVRTPSRIETSGSVATFAGLLVTADPSAPAPVTSFINGNENFESEDMLAYELGYRVQPRENLSIDLAVFYNDYENLRSYEVIDLSTVVFGNKSSGHTSGMELVLNWHPASWWKLQTSYSTIDLSLQTDADSLDPDISVNTVEDSSPEQQFYLRSIMDLNDNLELDLWAYHVDKVPAASIAALTAGIEIDSYTSYNARLGWKVSKDMQFSLVVLNLQGKNHAEFVGEYFNNLTQVERSVYAKLVWNF